MKEIDKIVITRPHVAVGKELGFLKGDLQEKTMPWALPVLDVLEKHLGKGAVETGIKAGNIEMAPLALMRGRSFDNAFIIVDETQNITTHELKMLLTRVGEGTTIVLNGDVQQSDLKEADGLTKVIHMAKKHMLPVPIIEFNMDDIIRSDITKMWVKTFYAEDRPIHYGQGKIECIDYIEDFLTREEYIGYLRGNIAKYLHRWRYKNGVEDLKKAE
ncbi:unnamed protein product, partial [Cyprideis torosa]